MRKTRDQCLAALNGVFYCDDLGGPTTVRGYLRALLSALWREKEGFSGKRPLGNSGWDYDLALPLVECGLLAGTIVGGEDEDETPYAQDFDEKEYDALVQRLIALMCEPDAR